MFTLLWHNSNRLKRPSLTKAALGRRQTEHGAPVSGRGTRKSPVVFAEVDRGCQLHGLVTHSRLKHAGKPSASGP